MVANYRGGEIVPAGIYWSRNRGEFVSIPDGDGRLTGDRTERYLKAPIPLVLILGPLMGLAYFVFLPLSGLLVLVPFLAGKVRGAVSMGKLSAAHMASPERIPGVSYLEPQLRAGGARRDQVSRVETGEQEGRLVDLAEELAKRAQGK